MKAQIKKEKPLSIDRGVRTLFGAVFTFTRARTSSDRPWAQTKGDTTGRRRGSLAPTLASGQAACQSSERAASVHASGASGRGSGPEMHRRRALRVRDPSPV